MPRSARRHTGLYDRDVMKRQRRRSLGRAPFLVVAYDIADARRLRRVRRTVMGFGAPAQESVFHCRLWPEELMRLQAALALIIDHSADTVRYYPLCEADVNHLKIDGIAQCIDFSGYIVV